MSELDLDPTDPQHRRMILYGNIRIWSEAAKIQWNRIASTDNWQTGRHIDAALFAIALQRFEQAVRRAIKEYDSDALRQAFREYKKAASSSKTVRNVLHYVLEYSLAEGKEQLKEPTPDPARWRVTYEKSKDDFVVRIGPNHRLSIAKSARATDAVVDVAWEVVNGRAV